MKLGNYSVLGLALIIVFGWLLTDGITVAAAQEEGEATAQDEGEATAQDEGETSIQQQSNVIQITPRRRIRLFRNGRFAFRRSAPRSQASSNQQTIEAQPPAPIIEEQSNVVQSTTRRRFRLFQNMRFAFRRSAVRSRASTNQQPPDAAPPAPIIEAPDPAIEEGAAQQQETDSIQTSGRRRGGIIANRRARLGQGRLIGRYR